MRLLLISGLAVLLAVGGCGQKNPESGPITLSPTNATPEEKLYEQLRSGLYQINSGVDLIAEAFQEAKGTNPSSADLKQSLEDIQDSIDTAGDALTEEAADEAKKGDSVQVADRRRKKLIDITNDSLHDLRDARGIVDSLAPEGSEGPLEPVGVKIDAAMEALRGALEALGGKEEVEE